MKFHVPSVLYTRPAFWPWAPGQQLGFEDDAWSCAILEHQLLLAWWQLPGKPQPADASAFLAILRAGAIDALLPRHVLQLFVAKKLVHWSAWYSVWYRTDPATWRDGAVTPDELEQRLKFHAAFQHNPLLFPAWLAAVHRGSRGFTTHSCTPSPPVELVEQGAVVWRGRWERVLV